MTSKMQDGTPTFEEIARLIAKKQGDVEWLADGLRCWVWPQEGWPAGAEKLGGSRLGMFADMARIRWPRARLVKVLKETLPGAADTISNLLSDWALMNILGSSLGPGFGPLDRVTLHNLLFELRRRCGEAAKLPQFVSSDGNARPGRTKALAPGQVDEKVACASAVAVAWKLVRDEPPGPRARAVLDRLESLRDFRIDVFLIHRVGWRRRPADMGEPLSTDLRERVVDAVNGGMSRRQAAAHFKVGVSSAIRWVAQALATGDLAPKRQGGDRRSAAIEAQADFILSLLGPGSDATLAEMRAALAAKGHSFSISALSRFFARRRITLKKSPRTRPSKIAPIS